MSKFDVILFDLDGTLTDPKEGITQSIRYALEDQGITGVPLKELEQFIGPPLKWAFKEYFKMNDSQVDQAVRKFRERFTDQGIFENEIFDGIASMLKHLKNEGKQIALATSKPTVFAKRILEHFNIVQYFDIIEGSHMDESRTDKTEIMQAVLSQIKNINPSKTAMVGDRKYDMDGAKACGLHSIGVLFGYGSKEELENAGAEYIIETVEQLKQLLSE